MLTQNKNVSATYKLQKAIVHDHGWKGVDINIYKVRGAKRFHWALTQIIGVSVCVFFTYISNLYNHIKGLVHPKMKIKSLITHPHAVPTP